MLYTIYPLWPAPGQFTIGSGGNKFACLCSLDSFTLAHFWIGSGAIGVKLFVSLDLFEPELPSSSFSGNGYSSHGEFKSFAGIGLAITGSLLMLDHLLFLHESGASST